MILKYAANNLWKVSPHYHSSFVFVVNHVTDMETIFRPYRKRPASAVTAAPATVCAIAKVREAIRNNIADIAEESIIGKDNNRIVKVPIRGVKEYRFVYGENVPGVGQGGDGELSPAKRLARAKKGPGVTRPAIKPASITMKPRSAWTSSSRSCLRIWSFRTWTAKTCVKWKWSGSFATKDSEKGIRVRLDKKRTARSRVKRKKASQRADVAALHGDRFPFHKDDLRYHHTVTETRRESNAVVLCIMDTSGSMDTMKKYLARSFFFSSIDFFVHAMKTSKLSSSHTTKRKR